MLHICLGCYDSSRGARGRKSRKAMADWGGHSLWWKPRTDSIYRAPLLLAGAWHQTFERRLTDVKLEYRPRIVISIAVSPIAFAIIPISVMAIPVAGSVVTAFVAVPAVSVPTPVMAAIIAVLRQFYRGC